MNWNKFAVKYNNQETSAFEKMSYLLFCAEFNNRVGIFRYKNQVGIETEPFEKDGKYYGFQSKFYTTPISNNKDDIINSINKAKLKNKQLDELYLYVNQELSESTINIKKKPQYQYDIERAAKTAGISIQWRVPSYIELQLSLPENKYIHDIFFNLNPNEYDLLDEMYKHNDNILRAIQTEISYKKTQIKIDRSSIIKSIANDSRSKKNIIISGEGGCGKTAIVKELYYSHLKEVPFCIFKANELNVNHINDIFNLDNKFTFFQFLDVYKDEPLKIFVIDSAEKLAEISNNDILSELLVKLKDNNWSIIFTTRYAYLNDLIFVLNEKYHLQNKVVNISLIDTDELKSIADKFKFFLPDNLNFLERLKNLFYLKEYIQHYLNIDKQGNYKRFIELLWKKRIQNTVQKDNLHLEREKCIISIAKQRCETGRFYINAENLPQSALFHLNLDEILGYNEVHNGYFITHDIYEEWALDKIVSRCFSNHTNIKEFFDDLGDSLPIRRAFRLWLSNHISENTKDIEDFILNAFSNSEIIQFWKDEILISVLLSDYSGEFFRFFEKDIIADDFKILKRILFLLRIACTDISVSQNIEIKKPKGKGWEEVIALIYKHKSSFFNNNFNIVLPILNDWGRYNKNGLSTRFSGLLALSLIQKTETEENFYMLDKVEESILIIIYNSASELKDELKEIFDKVLANKWTRHGDPYQGLCSKVLTKPYLATELIRVLPLYIIELCNLFWHNHKDDNLYGYSGFDTEKHYGIVSEFKQNYFPASAFQTPIYLLLQNEFKITLDFIINFTNNAVETYSKSAYHDNNLMEITLHIDGKEVKQYLNNDLWGMYRGINGSAPDLLQSIHMALEKFLLEISSYHESETIESYLKYILVNSKSSSLTSIVSSVVLANSEKFHTIALFLFKTIELFHTDSVRCLNELMAKNMYSIGYGLDKTKDVLYTDERLKTCDDKHRNSNLESLFLTYQIFGVEGFTEDQNSELLSKLYGIIDNYKSNKSISKDFGILLARMDRRNLVPSLSKKDDENNYIVEFNLKNISDEDKKKSEEALNENDAFYKYSSLKNWSNFLHNTQTLSRNERMQEYDINPILALSETKELIEEQSLGLRKGMHDYSIPAYSCSKLLIEHNDELLIEDRCFCKDIILDTICNIFNDDYDYQIGDGVEASFHAFPSLINKYPEEINQYISIMVLSLLDETPIGNYKRVCDYLIESIHESKLWETNQKILQTVLFGYIKIKPLYDKIASELRIDKKFGRINKSSIWEKLDMLNIDLTIENSSFDINNISLLDIHSLEIIFQLIPYDTKDLIHLDVYAKSLPLLASQLFKDRRSYKDDSGDNSNIYSLRLRIFKKVSYFILNREINEIDVFLKSFVDSFSSTRETASFIVELISAEDYLNRYEQFWHIWYNIYPKIKELCENPQGYHLQEIIINYLLAWNWWRDEIEDWHSLKEENLSLYANASKDIGYIPAVLYSISKVLNSIGSNFKNEGIDWIHKIISTQSTLNLADLESNTLYYLERFLRKYIFTNRQKIKEEIRLKNKIIPILNFIIEKGSIHGYLLRESVL